MTRGWLTALEPLPSGGAVLYVEPEAPKALPIKLRLSQQQWRDVRRWYEADRVLGERVQVDARLHEGEWDGRFRFVSGTERGQQFAQRWFPFGDRAALRRHISELLRR